MKVWVLLTNQRTGRTHEHEVELDGAAKQIDVTTSLKVVTEPEPKYAGKPPDRTSSNGARRMTIQVTDEMIKAFHVAFYEASAAPDRQPGSAWRAGIAAALEAMTEGQAEELYLAKVGKTMQEYPKR